MTSRPVAPDFSAREAPFAVKVTGVANAVTWILFVSPLGNFLWGLASVGAWSFVLTRPVRSGHSWWVALLEVAVAAAIMVGAGLAAARWVLKGKWFSTLLYGKPRFAPIQSPGRRQMNSVLRCVKCIEIGWKPDEARYFSALGQRTVDGIEELYHRRYVAQFDEEGWPRAWQQIQDAGWQDITYIGAVKSNYWDIISLRFALVRKLVLMLLVGFWAGYAWFIADVAQGASALRVVQFTLVSGFVGAAIMYVNFTVSMRMIVVDTKVQEELFAAELQQARELDPILDDLLREMQQEELPPELQAFEGRQLFPTIRIKEGYSRSIRNAFLPDLFAFSLLNALNFLLIVVLVWPFSLILSNWSTEQLNEWTSRISLGLLLAPVAVCLSFTFAFFLFARSHTFASLVTTGVFLALVPPLVTYIFGGDIGANTIVSSVIAGLAGILSSAVAELAKKRPSAELPA